ncbi:hypothetical protein [Bradyrhizobium sp. Y36]|uniref:hypothetical protein n=1 Tax=Bradyrhizobium sp. Y36 TaxID=2035447 RepID=UPI0013042EDD|nr:hypothetical protein [Bradyrhizobium sp. Y36]
MNHLNCRPDQGPEARFLQKALVDHDTASKLDPQDPDDARRKRVKKALSPK